MLVTAPTRRPRPPGDRRDDHRHPAPAVARSSIQQHRSDLGEHYGRASRPAGSSRLRVDDPDHATASAIAPHSISSGFAADGSVSSDNDPADPTLTELRVVTNRRTAGGSRTGSPEATSRAPSSGCQLVLGAWLASHGAAQTGNAASPAADRSAAMAAMPPRGRGACRWMRGRMRGRVEGGRSVGRPRAGPRSVHLPLAVGPRPVGLAHLLLVPGQRRPARASARRTTTATIPTVRWALAHCPANVGRDVLVWWPVGGRPPASLIDALRQRARDAVPVPGPGPAGRADRRAGRAVHHPAADVAVGRPGRPGTRCRPRRRSRASSPSPPPARRERLTWDPGTGDPPIGCDGPGVAYRPGCPRRRAVDDVLLHVPPLVGRRPGRRPVPADDGRRVGGDLGLRRRAAAAGPWRR